MKTYFISHDLRQEHSSSYTNFAQTLQNMGAKPAQKNGWFLDSPLSSLEIYNQLSRHMNGGDELMVTEIVPSNSAMTKRPSNTHAQPSNSLDQSGTHQHGANLPGAHHSTDHQYPHTQSSSNHFGGQQHGHDQSAAGPNTPNASIFRNFNFKSPYH